MSKGIEMRGRGSEQIQEELLLCLLAKSIAVRRRLHRQRPVGGGWYPWMRAQRLAPGEQEDRSSMPADVLAKRVEAPGRSNGQTHRTESGGPGSQVGEGAGEELATSSWAMGTPHWRAGRIGWLRRWLPKKGSTLRR